MDCDVIIGALGYVINFLSFLRREVLMFFLLNA
jgi:hypothetical protein